MASSTTASPLAGSVEMSGWKTLLSHSAALVVAFLFICAGVYKALDPYKFANLAKNLLVPYNLTLPLALMLAVAETTAGILILVPRFRRWGAILAGLLLLAFMTYIGWNYKALIGRDCSCFPVLTLPFGISIDMRRSVGPGFFYGDFAFLAAAAIAGFWAKRSQGLRTAAVILGAVAVFTAVSYGSAYSKLTGLKAPDSILVDGQPMSLQQGRFFLFFYDPECGTCNAVGKSMGPLKFKSDITYIGIPTRVPQFAAGYLHDNGLNFKTSTDSAKLREVFKFDNPPYAALIERGRQTGVILPTQFDEYNPEKHIALLRQMGVIE
ncbi:MAG: MauE/DoxX family redox-associated membrane protein [Bryobacteraceae bacterium]